MKNWLKNVIDTLFNGTPGAPSSESRRDASKAEYFANYDDFEPETLIIEFDGALEDFRVPAIEALGRGPQK